MTRDEILAMEPGREMDALVSVEIMKRDTCAIHRIGPGEWCRKCNSYAPERHSTDWGAAGLVVEKVLETHEITIQYSAIPDEQCWWVTFSPIPYSSDDEIPGMAAAEAICKAALIATLEASH